MIVIEGLVGEYLDDVIDRALDYRPCTIKFNNWICSVSNADSHKSIREKWESFQKKEAEEYWTVERLAKKEKKIQEEKEKMSILNDELKLISSKWELLDWFIKCEKISTLNTQVDIDRLKEVCEKLNISSNMNCDDDVERFNKQAVEYRLDWLLGQCLSCTIEIGCPHSVIHNFAEELKNEQKK